MRPLLAQALVMLVGITSLSAASRLNNSTAKPPTAAVRAHKVKPRRAHHPAKPKSHAYEVGRASWYGKAFHGKKTASGETYNMFEFTAAHPELPLGTYVKVTNLRNSRWVVVRINDRGPVPQSRIIDLSYGAAQMLGLRAHGVERVRLDLVEPPAVASNETELAGIGSGGGR